MKLLHTSDWHLGMTYRSGMGYAADQEFFIKEIAKIATDRNVDGILIAGDVFDKSIASQEALKLYDEAMTYICGELNIPVYIIAGNHDGAARLASCNELLEKSGLHIAGILRKSPQKYTIGDVDIYMLPWISTDRVMSTYPDGADDINSIEDAYRVVLNKYREQFVKGQKNILLAHAFITNAETSSSDKAALVGQATMINSSLFEGFDYVALGHLHGPQQINGYIRYSGTPMPYSFGKEESQEKSVTIIDTDNMELEIVPLKMLRKRKTIKGSYADIINAKYDDETKDAYIRLEITDSYVGLDSIGLLREKFSNLLEVSSKSFEKDNAQITMTIEEFEDAQNDPESIFLRYCQDIMEEEPSKHIMGLFKKALKAYEKEGNL